MKRIASSRLSIDSQVCMDAQSEVKQYVKNAYMRGATWLELQPGLKKIIDSYVDEITLPALKESTRRSLYQLAANIYGTLWTSPAFGDLAVLSAVLLIHNKAWKTPAQKAKAEKVIINAPASKFGEVDTQYFRQKAPYGTEVQQRVTYYMRNVKNTVRRLAQAKALDPDDTSTVKLRNSLRATAEIMVRQADHDREIAELKQKGTNLVICSTHADCSDRCFPWQGRVYSLDGSTGKTDDGREYVPLETATDVYVTTKAGRTYRNGLLGFNCRHRLVEYVAGRKPPAVSKETQQREKKIDQKQREYERAIINARENAIMLKDVDNARYRQATATAQRLMQEYIQFSHEHGRHYYTSRVRIL